MTDERETRLQRAMRAMDKITTSEAINRALARYLADKRVEALSTACLPIERETTIGE